MWYSLAFELHFEPEDFLRQKHPAKLQQQDRFSGNDFHMMEVDHLTVLTSRPFGDEIVVQRRFMQPPHVVVVTCLCRRLSGICHGCSPLVSTERHQDTHNFGIASWRMLAVLSRAMTSQILHMLCRLSQCWYQTHGTNDPSTDLRVENRLLVPRNDALRAVIFFVSSLSRSDSLKPGPCAFETLRCTAGVAESSQSAPTLDMSHQIPLLAETFWDDAQNFDPKIRWNILKPTSEEIKGASCEELIPRETMLG